MQHSITQHNVQTKPLIVLLHCKKEKINEKIAPPLKETKKSLNLTAPTDFWQNSTQFLIQLPFVKKIVHFLY